MNQPKGVKMTNEVTKKIYEKLLTEVRNGLVGKIIFKMNSIEFEIDSKDGIGGHIQDWFEKWMTVNSIQHSKRSNSQEFPDFFIHDSDKKILLEIKCFDVTAGANFDIANFQSYCESLAKNPERINSDYLIFGYTLKDGKLVIEKVWLNKIWEICCASERYPLKTQVKRDVIYNIRPASFDAPSARYKPFQTKDEFVKALYDTEEAYLKKPSQNKLAYLQKIST
jgi:hypothetical protein